jgi:mannose-1-phosphate guanylyltransferase/mannose-6-phosphate isomerase
MIYPVLLAGGSGTRLWPLSRKSYPKQFAPLAGEMSLFQEAALRFSGEGFAPPTVITAAEFRFTAAEALRAAGLSPGAILLEPEARNTAPAVLAASLFLAKDDPDALMLVSPSDHAVPDGAALAAAVREGEGLARAGRIVTFGIAPERPETGYGYIELLAPDDPGGPIRFVEKPSAARAEEMIASGRFLWNAGLFLFAARTILAAFDAHAPGLLPPVRAALEGARADLDFLRLDAGAWTGAEAISLDYAVMEKAGNLAVVPYGGAWSDLGGWDAVWRAGPRDAKGVAAKGPVTALDCADTLLRAESPGQELVGIGLHGIVAVAMPDAVLVAAKDRAQEVKQAVAALRAKGARQAGLFPREYRPWGWFESLAKGERFQVKRIVVHPGGRLSLQSHMHRAEHWVVVQGTAKVTIGEQTRLLGENQSVYVPLGARHRLENPGMLDVVLIEVQTGAYLGEDDIARYEDAYARPSTER